MNAKLYVPHGNQSGAGTSAAKVNRREGHKPRRVGFNEVGDGELARLVDAGYRFFWAKRNWAGVFEHDADAAFRSGSFSKERA